MRSTEIKISEVLESYTASISNFEPTRNYISLSNAVADVKDLMKMKFEDSLLIRLKCYKGYQMDRDLLERITKVFYPHILRSPEITAFDGMVKGHPDFLFDGFPADCKAVPLDEHLPVDRVPKKVYWQMYMLYSSRAWALVVYESRESGRIKHFWIPANSTIQQVIDVKYRTVVETIRVQAHA